MTAGRSSSSSSSSGGGGIICRRLPVLGQPQRGRVGGLNRNSASRRRPLTPTKAVKNVDGLFLFLRSKTCFKNLIRSANECATQIKGGAALRF